LQLGVESDIVTCRVNFGILRVTYCSFFPINMLWVQRYDFSFTFRHIYAKFLMYSYLISVLKGLTFHFIVSIVIQSVPKHLTAGKVWQRYGKWHKKPSAKPGNLVPRVKVLNYLKKVALFFRFERYFTCACPATATRASRMVMMVFLFIFISFYFICSNNWTRLSRWRGSTFRSNRSPSRLKSL